MGFKPAIYLSYQHNNYPSVVHLWWLSRIFREECRILGCERAYARSHPKMRGLTTGIPKEPLWYTGINFAFSDTIDIIYPN